MPGWGKWTVAVAAAVVLVWIGWHVPYLLVTLHVLLCFVLIVVIMLQSGSAADLAGAFGGAGSQTAFGPRGATTFLSRATTWCAIAFMMTALTLSVRRSSAAPGGLGSILEQVNPNAPAPAQQKATVPAAPAPKPAQPAQKPAPAPKK